MNNYIKRFLSFILLGRPKKTIANISYLQPSNLLSGKKIIITGGSRGLGYSMAMKFKAEGAEVLIAGRNEDSLKLSAEELDCKYLVLDVQNVKSFKSFIEKADDLLGGINCLVNNAGVSLHEASFLDVTEEQFDVQFGTNLKGPFFLTQAFIDYVEKGGNGFNKVLFISSETSMTADERPYGLSKAALNSLVQGLAYRYADVGIRINAVAPGVTLSDMVGNKDRSNIANMNLTHRFFLPEEVAEIACFLLSDASNCVNGQILFSNEGNTINARWK